MIRWVLGIFFALICMQLYGQQTNRRNQDPSLNSYEFRKMASVIEDPDSLISYYAFFASSIGRRFPDSTLSLSHEVMTIDGVELLKRKAYKNYILSIYWNRSSVDSSLFYNNLALKLFIQLNNDNKVLELKIAQARLYARANEYLKAEEMYLNALDYSKSVIRDDNRDLIFNELASLYIRVGAIDLALKRYKQQLEIEVLTPENECRIHTKISNAYKRNNQFELAKQQLLKCEDEDGIDEQLRIAVIRSISDIDKILGNNEDQIKRLRLAVELEEKIGRKDFLTYLFLAKAYFEEDEIAKVDSLITILDGYSPQRVPLPSKIDYQILKTKFYIREGDLSVAKYISEEAIKSAKKLPPTPLLADAYKLQAEIYEKLGDYQAAYNITKSIIETENYVKERARISLEAMGKVRFQMRAKNQELENVTTELGTVKTRNAIVIFVLVFLALYVFYRYRIYFLLKEERTRNEIARDLHDDLSATLSSISFFSEAAKREDQESNSSSKFLERIDESAIEAKEKINDIIWAIDPENDDWTAFLTKCKRYSAEMFESKNIDYEIDIDTTIDLPVDLKARKDLWLMFKEIITNLVRHSKSSKAKVIFKVKKGELLIVVEDNGVGFDLNGKQKGNGISNINKRMDVVSKNNSLDLSSKVNEGTKWKLKFNF